MKKLAIILLILSSSATADQITHRFKSPSFSGINQSQHYLTIENQEASRKQSILDEIEADLKELEREEKNSTVNRFLRNFESRIYSKLSKELVESLFSAGDIDPNLDGRFYFQSEDYYIRYYMREDGTLIMETYPGKYGEEGAYEDCAAEDLCTRIIVPVDTFG